MELRQATHVLSPVGVTVRAPVGEGSAETHERTGPWSPLLVPGALGLLSAPAEVVRPFHQELAHFALHTREGCVLWADGEHGFNPYDFADLNLARGFDADWGAERILVKRCLTPFQWDTVLTKHLAEKLLAAKACMVLAAPYEALFSTDELSDWEREDYVDFSLRHLKELAVRHNVPVVLSVDMGKWSRAYPTCAWKAYEAADHRWTVVPLAKGWRATEVLTGKRIESEPLRQHTLSDFAPVPGEAPVLRAPVRPRVPSLAQFA